MRCLHRPVRHIARLPGDIKYQNLRARLIGRERNSRLVGKVLGMAEYYGRYPCHRVVNHAGRLVPGWFEQRELLLQEGATLRDMDHVDLKACQWDGEE